jgi:hypothetical protein
MKPIFAILASLACSGCLSKRLATPASDHCTQTKVIELRCAGDGYTESPCSEELQEDISAMREQACLIPLILKGKAPQSEGGAGE